MEYINQYLLFEYTIDESEIVYLFMYLIYQIKYNETLSKLKIKKLNNFEKNIEIKCQSVIIIIDKIEQIIDVSVCKGEFQIRGNNSLIYINLPISLNNEINIFNNTQTFKLSNNKEFIFIPNNNQFNSINIFIEYNDFSENEEPILLTYYANHNVIPFSRIISRKSIKLYKNNNIVIANYQQNYINKEEYYIYFRSKKLFPILILKLFMKI